MNNDILDPVQGQDRAHHVFGAVIHPVYRGLSRQTKNVVGFLVTSVAWDSFFARNIPPKADDMLVYLNNTCGESAAYEIHNGKVSPSIETWTRDGRRIYILFSNLPWTHCICP